MFTDERSNMDTGTDKLVDLVVGRWVKVFLQAFIYFNDKPTRISKMQFIYIMGYYLVIRRKEAQAYLRDTASLVPQTTAIKQISAIN